MDRQLLDEQISQCRDVLRISRLVLLACVVVVLVMLAVPVTRPVAAIPVVACVPVVVNIVFHRWQLVKLRIARERS